FLPGGAPHFGRPFYAPLSPTLAPDRTALFVFSLHIMGLSSIMGTIDVTDMIVNMRAAGITWFKLPLFVWTWLLTAFLLYSFMPVVVDTVQM
ncbi:hypothetical protein UF37_03035, partial [Vibrio parahaemolyticus]